MWNETATQRRRSVMVAGKEAEIDAARLRTEIKPQNKNFKLPPWLQLEPALETNVTTCL